MIRIPLLRAGRPYWSVETALLADYRTGEPVAEVSQANAGLIHRDLAAAGGEGTLPLREIPARDLIALCRRAADRFLHADLPLADGVQGPGEYLRDLSRTTGLPRALARKNMEKVGGALAAMEEVFAGLTRGLDPEALDRGHVEEEGRIESFAPAARALGAVLPSNSPGVHTLWLPAVPLKTSLVLKPGREEPWTPWRVIAALVDAGVPAAAFSFYPSAHEGAAAILRRADRSLLFGAGPTVRPWRSDPRIQIHGPGFSKVILGPDAADRWEEHLDLIESSILENGGRSCINASAVWTPCHAREIAGALAERLARVEPLDPEDEGARLAAFADPAAARRIDASIEEALAAPGAEDVTAARRCGPRLVARHGGTYLLPTVVFCTDRAHPLADREFLFPYASVVEASPEETLAEIGQTLVATVITEDPGYRRALLASPRIDRLNLGPVPTWKIAWDRPHEGNLFDLLWRRRALQLAGRLATGGWRLADDGRRTDPDGSAERWI
jgi:acyl-CoA reductase-like NAD-dependent aldehyde dehydrogenase